jgi:acyl carrier protein
VNNVEMIVRRCLCQTLSRPETEADRLDLAQHLKLDYGLASLDLIVLMTSVCTAAEVPLTEFSEDDISTIQTPVDIVALLSRKSAATGSGA